jgi:Leucine-rich repeat (LRR) protein
MFKYLVVGAVLIILGALAFYGASKNESVAEEEIFTEVVNLNNVETIVVSSKAEIKEEDILNLSGQGLTKAPEDIFDKTNLKELNLSNNQLGGTLQAEVRNLSKLTVLNLSNNNFTGLPAEVGQLSQLQVLDLSNNNLTGLPYELGNLKNLLRLDLRGNDYAKQDLEVIKKGFVNDVVILVDGE